MAIDSQPLYYAAVVTVEGGDARIMCMAQRTAAGGLNVHYFKVDTSIDDVAYDFLREPKRSLRDDLRGTGLAVNILDAPVERIEEVIESDLHEAYGRAAAVAIKQVASPSIASLFA